MPKETKKFINPLLRPSQSTETMPVLQPQADVADEPIENVIQEIKAEQQEVQAVPVAAPANVPVQPETVQPVPTPKEPGTKRTRSTVENDSEKALAAEESRVNARRELSTTSPTSRSESKTRDVTPTRPRPSAARTGTASYMKGSDSSSLELTDFPANSLTLDEDYATYDASTASEEGRGAAKRRRSLQPFESTHERITLWIDKQLKQQFEELALQRELPKTALINEAVAALLEKYSVR